MRVVLDVNVIVSGLLSGAGTPAALLRAWSQGEFELVVSPLLLAELARTLAYPKLRERVSSAEARRLVEWLEGFATLAEDPDSPPPVRSLDPGDYYLLTLTAGARAILVSGDKHLLELAEEAPILTPGDLLRLLEEQRERDS